VLSTRLRILGQWARPKRTSSDGIAVCQHGECSAVQGNRTLLVPRLKPAGSECQVVLIESASRCKRSDPHAVFRKTQTLLGRNLIDFVKRHKELLFRTGTYSPVCHANGTTQRFRPHEYSTWRRKWYLSGCLIGFAGLRRPVSEI
jgi:hypothetical protein